MNDCEGAGILPTCFCRHCCASRAEKAQERRQEGTRHVSGIMGAENREGHSAASTGGASDLPELRSQEELDRMGRVPIWAWPVAAFKALLWGLGLGRWL